MDIKSIIEQYVQPLIMALCYSIGFLIKTSIPFIDNRFIPLIVSICGIFFNIWANKWKVSPEIILVGMASGLSATGMNELITHLI